MNSQPSGRPSRTTVFDWRELPDVLASFAQRWPGAIACADPRSFVAPEDAARLSLPMVAPRVRTAESIAAYSARAGGRTERQLVILLQAGAVSLGCWEHDELVVHKAIRKYVVRGNGRAQPAHLKTRGKSRYGSRLRLQNWRRLLVETNERLRAWESEIGCPERIFFSAPVRSWPELWQVDPAPPFARDDARLERIPTHVHRPDHEELLRVRAWLRRGSVAIS